MMSTNKEINLTRYSMNIGAYAGIAFISVSVVFLLMNAIFAPGLSFLNYFTTCFFIFIGITRYRDHYSGGTITYGRCLGIGTYIIFWSSLLYGFYFFILFRYIKPELKDTFLLTLEQVLQNTQDEAQVNTLMDIYRVILTPFMMGLSQVFGISFMGFFFSLFIAIFIRKNNQPTNNELN